MSVADFATPVVLIGGTPCQDFSVIGRRAGIEGARGYLAIEYAQKASAANHLRRDDGRGGNVIVWENVPGVLGEKGNPFGFVLAAMAGLDAPFNLPQGGRWPNAGLVDAEGGRSVAWRVFDAQYFGLAQRRERVYLVASDGESVDPAEILFEREGGEGDIAAGGAPAEDATARPTRRADATGGSATRPARAAEVSDTLVAHPKHSGCQADDGDNLIVGGTVTTRDDIARSVPTKTRYGQGQDTLVIREGGSTTVGDKANALRANASRSHQTIVEPEREVAKTILAGTKGAAPANLEHVVSGDGPRLTVRRLMPIECERLQGFPDGWTAIGSDTKRYEAIGNAMPVPVIRWIGERIARALGGPFVYGSICSGIEAATVAWAPLGCEAAWYSEIAEFPRRVLQERLKAVPVPE